MSGQEIRSTLGKNLKIYRSNRELSQEALAEIAGISVPFLSSIERGTKWPYPDTLSNLACALNIDVYELFKPYNNEAGPLSSSEEEKIKLMSFASDMSLALNNSIAHAAKQAITNVCKRHFGTAVHSNLCLFT